MFFFIDSSKEPDENTGYEKLDPHARQSVHEYISHVNGGFVPEEQNRDRMSLRRSAKYEHGIKPDPEYLELVDENDHAARIEDNIESSPDHIEPIKEYEDTVAERPQNVYDYIDGTIDRSTNVDFSRQEIKHNSISKLCGVLKKYKIPIIVTIILLAIIAGTVAAVILLLATGKTTESNLQVEGSLVIIGGRIFNRTKTDYDIVQIYTVDAGRVTWKRYGAPVPYDWTYGGTATFEGNIYIAIGGARDSVGQLVELYNRRAAKYNVRRNSWELLPNKTIEACCGPALYVIHNHLYAADGDNIVSSSHPMTQTEKLDLSDIESGWMTEPASPTQHDVTNTQAVVIGNTAYICAGDGVHKIKSVISWTYGEPAWTHVTEMNIARSNDHGTVTDGISSIWVVGGCWDGDCWPDGFIEHYSVENNTWTKFNQVPNIQRTYYYGIKVCVYWQGYIYVIFNNIPTFYVYNTETGEWHEDSTELMLPVVNPMSALVPETS